VDAPRTERQLRPRRAWDAASLRDPHGQPDKAARVEAMFDAIAASYERFNAVATFGRDAHWRLEAVAAADVRPGDVVLDVCCGTGDMLRVFARDTFAGLLLGVDFAANMLVHAHLEDLEAGIDLIRADALRLPLADESVDVISCAFGVRNFRDLQAGLAEMHRIARPGARVVILEFATPERVVQRWAYRMYCDTVLPWVGALLSHEQAGAYRYLPRSIRTFEAASELAHRLTAAGFHDVTFRRMNFGGVVLYHGIK
jgi:demethylmenaquinone methyltransferase/2-methoxy-6-polyprenyl-1,4-benzoquinol methylase